ncbi:MAG TPA: hypothetical protein VGG64_05560 [Pirellulales bacterium]|jgi:hypothetical protein
MTNFPQSPAERRVRLAEIRQAIEAGTYETPERLSAAVDALLDDFEGREDSANGPRRRPK